MPSGHLWRGSLEGQGVRVRVYSSRYMRIITGTAPKALRLPGCGRELSPRARLRLKWMDYYDAHGQDGRLTCRYLGISPQTFYRWKRRYNPHVLQSLEDRPRRPHHLRQPAASAELVEAVLRLRENYPRWVKDKLVLLLREEGLLVSTSTTAGDFFHSLHKRMPFPIRAIQVDGGSEYEVADLSWTVSELGP